MKSLAFRYLCSNIIGIIILLLTENSHHTTTFSFIISSSSLSPSLLSRQQQQQQIVSAFATTKRRVLGHTTSNNRHVLNAHYLNTAYEWLALERSWEEEEEQEENDYNYNTSIVWFHPCNFPSSRLDSNNEDGTDDNSSNVEETTCMPLYPLQACYMPSQNETIHTINNVENRNIQMALDLIGGDEKGKKKEKESVAIQQNININSNNNVLHQEWNNNKRFCVVLCTADTGRISSIGTIMRIVDTEIHYDPRLRIFSEKREEDDDIDKDNDNDDKNINNILRILVKCKCEQIVDIVSIINPDAASSERRVLRSSEYLIGRVRPISNNNKDDVEEGEEIIQKDDNNDDKTEEISEITYQLLNDYKAVRSMYVKKNSVGYKYDLPLFAKKKRKEVLPIISSTDYFVEKFWDFCQIWQSFCYTIREGRQINLSSDINELMIKDASRKGGPLNLPIHIEDLSLDVRQQIQQMEKDAQNEYLSIKLDPILDFQTLCVMEKDKQQQQKYNDINNKNLPSLQQLKFISKLVKRERTRLEEMKQQKTKKSSKQLQLHQQQNNSTTTSSTTDTDDHSESSSPPPSPPRKGAWFEGGFE